MANVFIRISPTDWIKLNGVTMENVEGNAVEITNSEGEWIGSISRNIPMFLEVEEQATPERVIRSD